MRVPLLVTAFLVWILVVACGLDRVWSYAQTPGPRSNPPLQWPEESSIPRPLGRWALVMAIHPRCPCTRATLTELEKVLAESPTAPAILAMVYRPAGSATDWGKSDAKILLASLKDPCVIDDIEGREAGRFGLGTSGEIAVYDHSGKLCYSGGITASRGHEGPNPGQLALARHLSDHTASRAHPVFGCPLKPSACLPEGGECR